MYLFEKELISPLKSHLKGQNMKLTKVHSQCGGLDVLTVLNDQVANQEQMFINDQIIEQIYFLYRDYI